MYPPHPSAQQNVVDIHALEGAASMAASGASGTKGGNFQIFEQFLTHSGAKVHLNTPVSFVVSRSARRLILYPRSKASPRNRLLRIFGRLRAVTAPLTTKPSFWPLHFTRLTSRCHPRSLLKSPNNHMFVSTSLFSVQRLQRPIPPTSFYHRRTKSLERC